MAFSIKNEIEQKVLGTNSELYDRSMKPTNSKKEFEFVWKMLNVLSNGEYSINISIFSETKGQQATFENVLTFNVNRSKDNYFSINPVTEVEVK
jgi:hypothetical protein